METFLLGLLCCLSAVWAHEGLLPPVILKPSVRDPSYQWRIIGSSTSGSTLNTQECVVKGNYSSLHWEGVQSNLLDSAALPRGWHMGNLITRSANDSKLVTVLELTSSDSVWSGGIFRCVVTYKGPGDGSLYRAVSSPIHVVVAYFGQTGKPYGLTYDTMPRQPTVAVPCINRRVYGNVSPEDIDRHMNSRWTRRAVSYSAFPGPQAGGGEEVPLSDTIVTAGDHLMFSPLHPEDVGFTNGSSRYFWLYSCCVHAREPARFETSVHCPGVYALTEPDTGSTAYPETELIASSARDVEAVQGETITVFCLFSADVYGLPTVHWSFGSANSSAKPPGFLPNTVNHGASVTFTSSLAFSGPFSCSVNNGRLSKQFQLTVKEPLREAGEEHDGGTMGDVFMGLRIDQSTSARFTCRFTSEPTSSVKWLLNGNVALPSANVSLTGVWYDELTLSGLTEGQGQMAVTCIASNNVGPYVTSARLILYDDPDLVISHSADSPDPWVIPLDNHTSVQTRLSLSVRYRSTKRLQLAEGVWLRKAGYHTPPVSLHPTEKEQEYIVGIQEPKVSGNRSKVSGDWLEVNGNGSEVVTSTLELDLTLAAQPSMAYGVYYYELRFPGNVVYRSEVIQVGLELEVTTEKLPPPTHSTTVAPPSKEDWQPNKDGENSPPFGGEGNHFHFNDNAGQVERDTETLSLVVALGVVSTLLFLLITLNITYFVLRSRRRSKFRSSASSSDEYDVSSSMIIGTLDSR